MNPYLAVLIGGVIGGIIGFVGAQFIIRTSYWRRYMYWLNRR